MDWLFRIVRRKVWIGMTLSVAGQLFLVGCDFAAAGDHESKYVLQGGARSVTVTIGSGNTRDAIWQLPFKPRNISVIGVLSAAESEVDGIVSKARGQVLTVAKLFALAQAIEDAHRASGYVLTRVLISPQRISNDANFSIKVVDVKLAKIDCSALPPAIASRVAIRLQSLLGRAALRDVELANAVGVAQFEVGQSLQVEAVSGDESDENTLVVKGPKHPWFGEASASTFFGYPFSSQMLSTTASTYSPFGFGERVTVSGTWLGEHEAQSESGPIGSAAATLQIPSGGMKFLEFSLSGGAMYLRDSNDDWERYDSARVSARLVLPYFISSNQTLIFKIGPDISGEKTTSTYVIDNPYYFSTSYMTSALRASATWLLSSASGISTELGIEGAGGLVDQKLADNYYMTDDRSEFPFERVSLRAKADIPTPFETIWSTVVRADKFFGGSAPASEQIQLLQINQFIPIDPQTIQGDSGVVVRSELSRKFAVAANDVQFGAEPYVFGTLGYLEALDPSTLLTDRYRGVAVGGGIRLSFPKGERAVPVDAIFEVYRQQTSSFVPNFTAMSVTVKTSF